MLRVMAAVALVGLCGCSAAQTQMANDTMAAQYVGQPADEFFLRYGPPSSKHQLDSGDTIYLWAENATVYNANGGVFGGRQSLSTSAPAVSSGTVVQCEVRIVASRSGTIRQILAQNDTIGKWQLSRCHELFAA